MGFGDKIDDALDRFPGRWFRKTIWDQGGHFLLGAAFAAPAWVCLFICHEFMRVLIVGLACSIIAATVWEAIQNWGDSPDRSDSFLKRTRFSIGPLPVNIDLLIDWFFRSAGGVSPALVYLAL